MQAEDWKKAKEILHEALQITQPDSRRAFLDSVAPDGDIRAEVESLLVFETEFEDFMSLSITDFSKDFLAIEEVSDGESRTLPVAAKCSLIGRAIGVYKIVGELGSGGMGAVYLAERADGKFARRVAIKMLRREFNTSKIRRRFEVEKEIQSRLDHPNIACLLDAGTADDGVPFLVMEYIEGLAIDKFCRENSLSLKDRLRLFGKVCDAVAFAHRNLIIHRDLKPSNILVTKNENVKLLDFGISKLLDPKPEAAPAATTILGAMTPEYAAPEQIKGEPVTTAADVYALGVVFYKILTDSHPFDLDGKTTSELLEIILNKEPIAPSEAHSRNYKERKREKDALKLTAEIPMVAVPTSASLPYSLSRLKGDLDNIILKSLSKEPERRYPTVEQFSEDVKRFLDGMPVQARPATFTYQASKFYRRNKIPVLASAAIILSLLAGITIALWQAREARGQARIASEAQKQALAEAGRAEKISLFMGKVISYANPAWYAEGAKFGGEAKVIDVIDDMSGKIDIEFAGQPDIQAELHHKFTEVYKFHARVVNAALAKQALEKELYHARRAIELRKQFYGERHELVAKDMFYLFEAGGIAEDDQARFLAEAIQMMRETNPDNLNLPYMLEAYTAFLMLPGQEKYHEKFLQDAIPPTSENKYQLAERYLLESLPLFRRHYSEDNIAIFQNECKLAYAQAMQKKFAEAEPHYRICKESAAKLQNENHEKIIRKHVSEIEEVFASSNFNF
jgi:serine/threonine protein kinase